MAVLDGYRVDNVETNGTLLEFSTEPLARDFIESVASWYPFAEIAVMPSGPGRFGVAVDGYLLHAIHVPYVVPPQMDTSTAVWKKTVERQQV